ncbi:MAG TPA: hypothetical protein VIJ37_01075 [Steroidobacteraceae bacterium]
MRLLWSLPKAAPVLLRHLAAYAELAALDFARAQRELKTQLVACAVLAVCLLFAILMGCLAVVACTWDTRYRLAAIAWMGGGFLVAAFLAALYRSNAARAQAPFLTSVRREWHEDRVILERILASDEE